jgi:tetratricopeptide (TPR) repeat protein
MPKSWGSVARRGASTINRDTAPLTEPKYSLKPPAPQDEWILEEDEEVVVEESVEQRPKIAITLPGDVSAAIRRAAVAMTAYQREKRVEQMQKAVDAYERNRYEEAARLANRLAQDLPEVTAIREIAGLSSYRSGQWRIARMHLERYRQLSTEPEYLPLEMDAARAMGRVRVVTDLFELLRQESPDPELLAEARLVVAGSIADRGKLREAIELLESNGAGEPRRKPADRHVRQWFALADLFDRAGETPRARRYFEMVDAADPDAYGVRDRLRDLGVGARKRTPRPRQRSIKKV